MEMFLALVIFVVTLFVYMLPSFIAYKREHKSVLAIVAMNVILGWTTIFWIWALIWSLSGYTRVNDRVGIEQ